jgi:hypothetical protein
VPRGRTARAGLHHERGGIGLVGRPADIAVIRRLQLKARRPVREYLAALESENSPVNPGQAPKAMSPFDPAAAWTTRGRHKVMFGYSLNYLIDLANAIIVDVEATPTRISKEVSAAETMIERTVARFALAPDHLVADVAYGTGAILGWLVERGIDPHIPVWDKSEVSANGKFPRAYFAYDHERDLYICGWQELKTSGTVHDGTTIKSSPSAATVLCVRSSGNARPAWSARSRATSIRMPATPPRHSCRPRPIGSHAPHGRRRSKSCLATPSIISRRCASDCAASVAPGTSSCSPPPSRISNAWQCTPRGRPHSP